MDEDEQRQMQEEVSRLSGSIEFLTVPLGTVKSGHTMLERSKFSEPFRYDILPEADRVSLSSCEDEYSAERGEFLKVQSESRVAIQVTLVD